MTFIEFFKKYADFQLSPQQEELLKTLEKKDKAAIHNLPNNSLKTKLFIADAIMLCLEKNKSAIATLTESQAGEIVQQINEFKVKKLVEAKISKFKKFRMVRLVKKIENTRDKNSQTPVDPQ